MTPRAGYTIIELLIASAIGLSIAALGTQHTFDYFKLQGTLVAKTELRHATQQVQDRLSQKLRQALFVMPLGTSQYVLVVASDVDRCGYVCNEDTYEVLWWTVEVDPLAPEKGYLNEKRIVTPAFEMPSDPTLFKKLFEKYPGTGRRVASSVESIGITNEGPGLYRTRVTVARLAPRQKVATRLTFTELIAARSKPRVQGVPKIEALLRPPGMGGAPTS